MHENKSKTIGNSFTYILVE